AKEYDCVSAYRKVQNKSRLKNQTLRILTDTLQLLLAYVYLIVHALKGEISVGEFTLYLSGMVVFNNTILDIANTVIDLKQYNEYFEPFQQFTEYLNHIGDGVERIREKEGYTIEFRNVSFRYPGQSGYALKNINLKMTSGESICIVGENGAGKTTLIKLLLRLYHVKEGEILLNGININRYKTEDYLNCFSVVFQDYKLFAASLKENIILNRIGQEGEQENLKRAMEMSGTAEVLLEKGIHEEVSVFKLFDETGIEFSGGESQKIAFARALYKDAPILLLDEPSSALDPLSEVKLLENLSLVSQGKLSVFISHRLTSAKICNRILVFHEGELVEDGSHEQLMERAAVYEELYRMQSQLY
ncbi:MAG: ABC transporter ATP-binding protein/permease, partial [Lachnospiraceae bacterium]|nr:ABC transporter ATP-binding protein/permease [Lachnospiraceae bacterium]